MQLVSDIIQGMMDKQKDFEKTGNPKAIEGCIESYSQLLNTMPDDPQIISQIGTAYMQIGQFGLGGNLIKRALDYLPDNANLWSNLGVCYRTAHILPKARDCFIKSLMLSAQAATYSNLACTYVNEDAPDKGIEWALEGMKMDENHPSIKWNAGLLYLEKQDWEKGFTYYEAGLFCKERPMRFYTNTPENDVPWWDGESPGNIALWDEQGLGDRIMFLSLINKLKGRATPILECHDRLEGVIKRSFPWVEHVYPTSKQDTIDWPVNHRIDWKLPVASLARYFWAGGSFSREPYLKPDPELVKKYREEFEKLGPGPYIAFSWHGGALKTNTQYRSLKLSQFARLMTKGTWISMQYHDWAKEKVGRFKEDTGLNVFHCDAAQERNYDHTLAALAACDLTISACNTVIHTCGAAGVPCWVMVPRKRAWRYPKTEYFPWYGDHIRMFHQEKDGEWDGVINQVKSGLESFE